MTMIGRLPRTKRNIVLIGLGVLILWFSWSIRSVLNPLLIGYLCAFILHPFVVRVEQLGLSKRSAVNLIFFSGFVGATLLAFVLFLQTRGLALEVVAGIRPETTTEQGEAGAPAIPGESVASESEEKRPFAERLGERLEAFTEKVRDTLGIDLGPVPELESRVVTDFALAFLSEHQEETTDIGLQAAQRSVSFLSRLLGGVIAVGGLIVLVPLYAYFLLFELGRLHRFVKRYLPKRDREHLAEVADQIGAVIANFFRGRLAVCFLKGLFLSIGLTIAGIDYAFLFGMVSGFLSLIPFFGPFIGFAVAATVGILDHSVIGSLVRCGIVFGVGELVEGYVLIPKVLGDSLGLHPLVVLFAMLAGGAALGMFGILISLPLTASLVILFREFVLPAMQKLADEEDPPGAPTG
jgi:predicted PurR-regulated permease PerM